MVIDMAYTSSKSRVKSKSSGSSSCQVKPVRRTLNHYESPLANVIVEVLRLEFLLPAENVGAAGGDGGIPEALPYQPE